LAKQLIFKGIEDFPPFPLRGFLVVVTTALILTFSPEEKGQRLQASLYAVVRRANPVAGAWWFRGSMREFFGEFSPRQKSRFRPPLPGLNWFYQLSHGFTVGYYRMLLRS
jgi:hypothetical protein